MQKYVNHNLCEHCWYQKNPTRQPITVRDGESGICCACGCPTYTGIFVRGAVSEYHSDISECDASRNDDSKSPEPQQGPLKEAKAWIEQVTFVDCPECHESNDLGTDSYVEDGAPLDCENCGKGFIVRVED